MAGGYDGSLTFDTSIDSKGFNAGMARLSSSVKGVMSSIVGTLAKVATVGISLVAILAAVGLALVGLAVGAAVFGVKLINAMSEAVNRTNAYGQEIAEIERLFADVKGACYAAFSPLISAALPYIRIVVGWLVNMLNTVSMIMAALLGQKTVMQYIAGSADTAANSTGRLAENTKKADKAAKGALAAFDELNVLNMDNGAPDASGGGAGVGGGAMQFQEVAVDQGIQEKVDAVKKIFTDAWDWVKTTAANAWDWIVAKVSTAWDGIVKFLAPILNWVMTNVILPLKQPFDDLVATAVECFNLIYTSFIQPLVALFVTYVWPVIQNVLGLLGKFIGNTFTIIVDVLKSALVMMTGVISGIIKIFTGIIEFLTGVFTGNWKLAWKGIVDIFTGIFGVVSSIIKGVMNTVIDIINGVIRAIALGLNTIIGGLNKISIAVPSWVPILGGQTWGFNIPSVSAPQIPKLATGAVIPPNAEFAAILGDQRSGRNIEAPEGLIRQIIQEEIGNIQGEFTINFGGSNAALVRMLKPYIDKENIRIGGSKVAGSAGIS